MTNDITKRLRANAEAHREVAYGCDMDPQRTANWQHAEDDIEASIEIERLRSLLKDVAHILERLYLAESHEGSGTDYSDWSDQMKVERAEWNAACDNARTILLKIKGEA